MVASIFDSALSHTRRSDASEKSEEIVNSEEIVIENIKKWTRYFHLFFFLTRPSDEYESYCHEYESYCMTQRRVENTRDHFWTVSPVSVNSRFIYMKILIQFLHTEFIKPNFLAFKIKA